MGSNRRRALLLVASLLFACGDPPRATQRGDVPAPAQLPAPAPLPATAPAATAAETPRTTATATAPRAPRPPLVGVRRDAGRLVVVSGDREAEWAPRAGAAATIRAVPLRADGSRWALASTGPGSVELATLDETGALAVLWASDHDRRVLDVRLWDLDGDGTFELVAHRTRPARMEIDIMLGASTSRYFHHFDGARFVPSDRPAGRLPPLEPASERLARAIEAEVGGTCYEHAEADVASSLLAVPPPPPAPSGAGGIGTIGSSSGVVGSSSGSATIAAGHVSARVCVAPEPAPRVVLALVDLRERRPRVLATAPVGPFDASHTEPCAGGHPREVELHVVHGSDDGRVRAIVPVWRDGESSWRAALFTFDGATLAPAGESTPIDVCPMRPGGDGLPFRIEAGGTSLARAEP